MQGCIILDLEPSTANSKLFLLAHTAASAATCPGPHILRNALYSIVVGLAIRAAETVAGYLANERARITQYINSQAGTTIPLLGVDPGFRQSDIHVTSWQGALPHWLPWTFVPLWLLLLAWTVF